MKDIKLECNLETGTWTIDKSMLSFNDNAIKISFVNNAGAGAKVIFNNLSFLFRISKDGFTIIEKTYPSSGIKYIETNDKYMICESVDLIPGNQYDLYVESTNDGQTYIETTILNVPYPEKLYTSWTWNETNRTYEPPVQYPQNSEYLWMWQENDNKWVKLSGQLLRGVFMKRLSELYLVNNVSILSKAESMLENNEYSIDAKIVWQYYTVYVRTDSMFSKWANEMGLTEAQLDTIFE